MREAHFGLDLIQGTRVGHSEGSTNMSLESKHTHRHIRLESTKAG